MRIPTTPCNYSMPCADTFVETGCESVQATVYGRSLFFTTFDERMGERFSPDQGYIYAWVGVRWQVACGSHPRTASIMDGAAKGDLQGFDPKVEGWTEAADKAGSMSTRVKTEAYIFIWRWHGTQRRKEESETHENPTAIPICRHQCGGEGELGWYGGSSCHQRRGADIWLSSSSS